ncbi:MAG: AMP-binding protein, partial [Candidatus Aminicenantes bacterium]
MRNNNIPGELAVAARHYAREKQYWEKKLSGDLVKTGFPYDKPGPKGISEDKVPMEAVKLRFTGQLYSKLMWTSNGDDHMLHMILTAGLVVLLNKYTGNRDIIVGVPIYKQDSEGEFVNTVLALRDYIEDCMTFKELLYQVKQTIMEADENQNYPLETLLYRLNINKPAVENDFSLFDIVILLENIHDKKYIQHIKPHMIISFNNNRTGEALECIWEFNTLLYEPGSVRKIAAHFTTLLQEALFNVDAKISGINILSAEEKKQLVVDFNNTAAAYPADKTMHELFAEQVTKTPDNIAVVSKESNLTYTRLNQEANQLAKVLKEKGAAADTIVAIKLERSLTMIIGIFAVLKADAAYLPIDPEYPGERVYYMLTDSSAKFFLTTPGLSERFEKLSIVNCQLLMVNE